MAIVHIDGNSMGQRFAQCETLAERRKLSDSVDRATKNAFEKLLKEIINHIKEARKKEGTSWLDFCIVYGGFSGYLEQIRKKQYEVKEGKFYFGPYLLGDGDDEKSIKNLRAGIKELGNREKWPRFKVKELRSVLSLGKEATKNFINEMELRNVKPPEIKVYLPSSTSR